MPADKYRFISPGVFTSEVDQSEVENVAIIQRGPVVIGRALQGPAFLPMRVDSYEKFVQLFGEPVAGGTTGDGWRNPNLAAPMYGTFAAQAYLQNNQPFTYVRLLGAQDPNNDATTGVNGWKVPNAAMNGGGAYGLYVIPSGTLNYTTGTLAAIWYCNAATSITLSGTIHGSLGAAHTGSNAALLNSTTNGSPTFKVVVSSSAFSDKDRIKTFNFSRNDSNYIRNVFATDPTQLNSNIHNSNDGYVLGQTYERAVNDLVGQRTDRPMIGIVLRVDQASFRGNDFTNIVDSADNGPPVASTGWFIAQDLNLASSAFVAEADCQQLFKIHGLYETGEDIQKKVKISIRDITYPGSAQQLVDPYPSFTVEVRRLNDTDLNKNVLESFTGLNLNPSSPHYIAAAIGDKYYQYNSTESRLETKGDYSNKSNYIRVEVHPDVAEGGALPTLMPFGVIGPPTFSRLTLKQGGAGGEFWESGSIEGSSWGLASDIVNRPTYLGNADDKIQWSWGLPTAVTSSLTGVAIDFPAIPLVVSASTLMGPSAAGQENAYFGVDLMESSGGKRIDPGVTELLRVLPGGVTSTAASITNQYVFTLDNVRAVQGQTLSYYYHSGSRADATSISALSGAAFVVTGSKINKFTTVLHGGFDGLDITEMNPFRNTLLKGESVGSRYGSTGVTNYAVHSIQRAMNVIRDPEFVDYNLASQPGLTNESLTDDLIDICEERGDALAIVDIENDYQPRAEGNPISSTTSGYPKLPNVTNAVNTWKARQTNSSYGSAFFPWVQTRDSRTGQLLWIPPSIAAMGTMGSSAARSELWFVPAGFNRGGLSQGSAGIPVVNVRRRLTSKNRDSLYEHRINPIASFPAEGIVVFGQKTCQIQATALDRINVRRLLIFLKKQISTIANNILFQQNVQATWDRFTGEVEPLLSDVKTKFGLTDYKFILDDTTTTPELIDRNILYAKILLKPARSIEYIALDFFITSTGASFED